MLFSVCEETQSWIHQLYLLHFILFSVYVNLRLAYVSGYIVLNTKMSHLSREEQSAQCWLLQIFMSLWLRSGLQGTPETGQAVAHPFMLPSPQLCCSGCWTMSQLSWPQRVRCVRCAKNLPCHSCRQWCDQNSPNLCWNLDTYWIDLNTRMVFKVRFYVTFVYCCSSLMSAEKSRTQTSGPKYSY